MMLIPAPPDGMLPGWSADVLAVAGWLLAGALWWFRRKKR